MSLALEQAIKHVPTKGGEQMQQSKMMSPAHQQVSA
jgi:hypothetical protein